MAEPDLTLERIEKLLTEIRTTFQQKTSDPNHFATLGELEALWGKLIGDTRLIYSDMFHDLSHQMDERELVRKKKLNTPRRESDSNPTAEPPESF